MTKQVNGTPSGTESETGTNIRPYSIPDNEFTDQFTGDMHSMDTMYHAYQAYYQRTECAYCGKEMWTKNGDIPPLCCSPHCALYCSL